MTNINRKLTPYNYTPHVNKRNMWIVIHYVGAVSTARNNADYFYTAKRGASAHYFVDEKEIWQVVDDENDAWHVGGASKYYNSCRNNNSIGIELCCKKNDRGEWYFEKETVQNAIELTAMLMKRWKIPMERLTTHHGVTGKICPEPFVRNPEQWTEFRKKVGEILMEDTERELTIQEKCKIIQEYYGFDENTTLYFQMYRYNYALIDKLYYKAKNGEK